MEKITDNIYILVILAMTGSLVLTATFLLLQVRSRHRVLLTKKKLLDAQVEHQQELLHAIIHSQETERRRIGMDLHDEVGSALSSLRLIIDHEAGSANKTLSGQCKTIIDDIIRNVRHISHNLAPLSGGAAYFYDAVADLFDQVQRSGKIQTSLQLPRPEVPLDEQTALALYRVISELVNNTIKHAGARQILLSFTVSGHLQTITYTDDGTGLGTLPETGRKGMGFRNIESRLNMIGATYTIGTGQPGFSLEIKLPLS